MKYQILYDQNERLRNKLGIANPEEPARDVNLSKGGFFFASSLYLGQTMDQFEQEFLLKDCL
ncbi:hypothetical protein [Dyadobacter beijingensis]|uniref:hypothetical protein n=1 Tax=Dyadobacter beijingensis TaxID=365489 RepID=UPI00036AD1EB|nr:hypothetical protein [Dyadobacter beijingensis]